MTSSGGDDRARCAAIHSPLDHDVCHRVHPFETQHTRGHSPPPAAGADLRAALVASCLRGAFPPVDLRAVCVCEKREAKSQRLSR